MSDRRGKLYIVSTPIGNLEDITLRAIKTLRNVHIIAAEDTRQTATLLHRYHIHTRQTSYHDHNKKEKAEVLIDRLQKGEDVALVSDAGTPGISDPGYYLIKMAIEEGIQVVPIPGPTAMISAISISGLPADSFVFEGFLPSKRAGRIKKLETLSEEKRTLIIFESPHRIMKTLQDILSIMGNRKISLTRELTKHFEEVIRGSVSEVINSLKGRKIKGEITLVIEGKKENEAEAHLVDYLQTLIEERGLSLRDAVQEVTSMLDMPRHKVYKEALKILKKGTTPRN